MAKTFFEQLQPEQKRLVENTVSGLRYLTDRNKIESLSKMVIDVLKLNENKRVSDKQ
jgi:DNA relaxase NicK